MLTAKLFAGLGSMLGLLAFLTSSRIIPSMNVELSVTHGVTAVGYGSFYWQLIGAVICGIFGFIYVAFARWLPRQLNQITGIVSFSSIALGFLVWLAVGFFAGQNSLSSDIVALSLFAAVFAFLIGCALFGANVAWGLFRILRVRS